MKGPDLQKNRKMIELPDIALAVVMGGFLAYVVFRWSQELGTSMIFGLIGSLITFIFKVLLYIHRIRQIANKLDKKPVDDLMQREIKKLKHRRYTE